MLTLISADATVYTVWYLLIIPQLNPSPLNLYVRAPPPDLMASDAPLI